MESYEEGIPLESCGPSLHITREATPTLWGITQTIQTVQLES
jgi:hypothetical protein